MILVIYSKALSSKIYNKEEHERVKVNTLYKSMKDPNKLVFESARTRIHLNQEIWDEPMYRALVTLISRPH